MRDCIIHVCGESGFEYKRAGLKLLFHLVGELKIRMQVCIIMNEVIMITLSSS